LLINVLLSQNKHAEAAKQAVELVRASTNKSELLLAAIYLEQCVAIAQLDTSLAPADQKAVSNTYAKQAARFMVDAGKQDAGNGMLENNLAWELVTNPKPELRAPARAVELALKSVQLAPAEGANWNTLGVAHYRAGDWKSAITVLEKSMAMLPEYDSFNLFFLAMAKWQLGRKDEARRDYDVAIEWMDKNAPHNMELKLFRREADVLLGYEPPIPFTVTAAPRRLPVEAQRP
jgi:tetratricopeptide (TPR) repeat protein